jgi:hypothetical protein
MTLTVRKGKINRHEHITIVLLSGKPVSPDEIRTVFAGTNQERVLYRLSTNIYNIRKDGGIIKVHKDGRKVTGYQLMNPQDFNKSGRYVGRTKANTNKVLAQIVPDVTEVVDMPVVETVETAETVE